MCLASEMCNASTTFRLIRFVSLCKILALLQSTGWSSSFAWRAMPLFVSDTLTALWCSFNQTFSVLPVSPIYVWLHVLQFTL